jgi:hypothetical protein
MLFDSQGNDLVDGQLPARSLEVPNFGLAAEHGRLRGRVVGGDQNGLILGGWLDRSECRQNQYLVGFSLRVFCREPAPGFALFDVLSGA